VAQPPDDPVISTAMTGAILNERIVVTGATGYIGSVLVAELRDHNEVHVLVRDIAGSSARLELPADQIHELTRASESLVGLFEQISPSIVFHLATHYVRHDDPAEIAEMVDANVRFGALVLDAASSHPICTVVLAGSHFQFAGAEHRPATFYAATKNALRDIAAYLQHSRGLRWVQVVLYDVYGPGDPRPKLVNVLIDRVVVGDTVTLPSPEPQHHFVYVDDVVAGLIASAIESRAGGIAPGESVFLTSDKFVTPSGVLDAVATRLGVQPVIDPKPYLLPPGSIMRPFEGTRPPGWAPQIDLKEGIGRTVEPTP
jgi:nucleoside-diphosphate-sugar epimerase